VLPVRTQPRVLLPDPPRGSETEKRAQALVA